MFEVRMRYFKPFKAIIEAFSRSVAAEVEQLVFYFIFYLNFFKNIQNLPYL